MPGSVIFSMHKILHDPSQIIYDLCFALWAFAWGVKFQVTKSCMLGSCKGVHEEDSP